jgi:nicotinamidase-related amidase
MAVHLWLDGDFSGFRRWWMKRKMTSALLVIDVQRALFKKSAPIYQGGQLLARINHLVERAREAGAQVIYIQHANDSFLAAGTEGWQLHSELNVEDRDLIIHKSHGNAFEATTLEEELEAQGIKHIIVCGLVTHGCVQATCLGGLKEGYRVTLVDDAHSSWSKDAAQKIIEWNQKLAGLGVEVKSSREIEF